MEVDQVFDQLMPDTTATSAKLTTDETVSRNHSPCDSRHTDSETEYEPFNPKTPPRQKDKKARKGEDEEESSEFSSVERLSCSDIVKSANQAKRELNAFAESKRRQISPSQFLLYNECQIERRDVRQVKNQSGLRIVLKKPIRPSEAFLGQPGYYEVDDYKPRQNYYERKEIQKQQRLEQRKIHQFYQDKGLKCEPL